MSTVLVGECRSYLSFCMMSKHCLTHLFFVACRMSHHFLASLPSLPSLSQIPMLLLLLRLQFCFRKKRIGNSSYNYMSSTKAHAIAAYGLSAGQPFEEASPQDSPLKRLSGGVPLAAQHITSRLTKFLLGAFSYSLSLQASCRPWPVVAALVHMWWHKLGLTQPH